MKKLLLLMIISVLGSTGCGEPEEGHVWKEQTDMIDKAEDVEKMLLETTRQRRELSGE